MRICLPKINHNYNGFQTLTRLYAQTKECFLTNIDIDMALSTWFDADMCAVLGAILFHLHENVNSVRLNNIPDDVSRVLSRNGFLSYYGGKEIPDRFNTAISYQRFEASDYNPFASYIEHEFATQSRLPEMSAQLLTHFLRSISELFDNAVTHSQSSLGIFSCGQQFHQKNILAFTIVDLGIGMRTNIMNHLGYQMSSTQAINWAVQKLHSTRRQGLLGGLGLPLLLDFIEWNNGSVQIVSDDGHWQQQRERVLRRKLRYPFPGTAVTIEINTADTKSYALSSELQADNIF